MRSAAMCFQSTVCASSTGISRERGNDCEGAQWSPSCGQWLFVPLSCRQPWSSPWRQEPIPVGSRWGFPTHCSVLLFRIKTTDIFDEFRRRKLIPDLATSSESRKHNGTDPGGSTPRIAAIYDYTDEGGKLLFQVLRHQPKAFKQRRPDGRGGDLGPETDPPCSLPPAGID